MTDSGYTHVFLIADRSGSMQSIREATQDGIREFFHGYTAAPGRVTASLFEFDDRYDTVFEHVPAADVPDYDLKPRGWTALLDAVGFAFTSEGAWLASLPEDERPGHVVAVIATDGQENRSREWTLDRVKDMITRQRDVYGWQVLFIGANMDAVQVGQSMGVARGQTMTYAATDTGTRSAYGTLSAVGVPGSARFGASFTDAERAAAVDEDPKGSA